MKFKYRKPPIGEYVLVKVDDIWYLGYYDNQSQKPIGYWNIIKPYGYFTVYADSIILLHNQIDYWMKIPEKYKTWNRLDIGDVK